MKTYRTYSFTFLKRYALASLLLLFVTAVSAVPEAKPSIFDFWQAEGLEEISLSLDMEALERNRRTGNSMNGYLHAANQAFEITYEIGGRFRRINCEMPPLRLHLSKKELKSQGFGKHNDFKLVTHCNSGPEAQEALLREALVYELYRQISPDAAYRSQLVRVNYINIADSSTTIAYGLLIEDTDELKARNELKTVEEAYNLPLENIDNTEIISLFQYMIGNADFSLIMQRNVKLFENKKGRITIIPYDFDYSGLVYPTYAKPDANIGQSSVQDRVWIWEYNKPANLKEARKLFFDKKNQLLDTVTTFPKLSEESKKEVRRYIREFYTELRGGQIGATTSLK